MAGTITCFPNPTSLFLLFLTKPRFLSWWQSANPSNDSWMVQSVILIPGCTYRFLLPLRGGGLTGLKWGLGTRILKIPPARIENHCQAILFFFIRYWLVQAVYSLRLATWPSSGQQISTGFSGKLFAFLIKETNTRELIWCSIFLFSVLNAYVMPHALVAILRPRGNKH